MGVIFTLKLLGDVVLSLFLTTHADKCGRRVTLIFSALLSAVTSFIFATTTSFTMISLIATVGILSPAGSDIGPFMAIELSALAQITPPRDQARVMGWYNLVGLVAAALGAITYGWVVVGMVINTGG